MPCVAAVCFGCGWSVGRRRACSEAARCGEREMRAVFDLSVRPRRKIVIGGCWRVCVCVRMVMEVSRQAKAEEPRAESSQTVYSSSWIAILTPARPQAPRRLLFLTLAPSLPSWLQLLLIQSTSNASPGETEGQRDSFGAAAASRSKSRWNWQSLYPSCSCRTVRARNCAKFPSLSLSLASNRALIADFESLTT